MNTEAFKLARTTLYLAVREFGFSRRRDMDCEGRAYYAHGPGKFEGEHWSIIHYYQEALDGGGDDPLTYPDGMVAADLFEVTDVERAAFKLESDTAFIALWYSDTGFVSMQELTANEYDQVREAWERDHATEESDS